MRAWCGCAAVTLFWLASTRGDELDLKFQIVTPRPTGVVATGLNSKGDLVGFAWMENPQDPGILDQAPIVARGKDITVLPRLAGYTAMFPAAISDDGMVVGRAGKATPRNARAGLRNQAFLWTAKQGAIGLGTAEGDNASAATGVARSGKRISGFSVGENRIRACIWNRTADGWKAVVMPHHEGLGSQVVAISDDGRRLAAVDGVVACLWTEQDDGQWKREVIAKPGAMVPRAVNSSGTVAGVRFDGDGRTHAVVRTRAEGYRQVPEPPGYDRSEASAVNNQEIVVGMIDGPRGSRIGPAGFAYRGGRLRIINEAGPAFGAATAINDQGQIAGVFDEEADEPQTSQPISVKPKADRPKP